MATAAKKFIFSDRHRNRPNPAVCQTGAVSPGDETEITRSSSRNIHGASVSRAQELTDSGGSVALGINASGSDPLGVADLVERGRELISAGKIGDARVLL